MDGRTLYNSSSFAGVNWDAQDTLLEDIDRIEVIRGPGATLWGANAVNGIINIITKNSSQTQGGFVTLGGGNEEKAFVGFRYGTSFNENTHGRAYFKYTARDDYVFMETSRKGTVAGEDAGDDWKAYQAGFRLDGAPSASDQWTIQGDVYRNRENQLNLGIEPVADPADSFKVSGWNSSTVTVKSRGSPSWSSAWWTMRAMTILTPAASSRPCSHAAPAAAGSSRPRATSPSCARSSTSIRMPASSAPTATR